jgi:DNA-binding winged helix-turn-helix (wHTH) protein/tetratricopeptide (TPR) repeat protein
MANTSVIRFLGFEVDPAARTLKYEGRLVPLGPKTFDLLTCLAQHPNEVVTKEELLSAVWPNAFVEESNLSQHAFLLRKALNSTGLTEPIVVTIPGRGYQFAATVEATPRPSPQTSAPTGHRELMIHAVQSVTRIVVEEDEEEPTPEPALGEGRPAGEVRQLPGATEGGIGWSKRWPAWAIAGVIAILAVTAAYRAWQGLHPAKVARVDLVLAEIENDTGDPDFDRTLNEALRIDLEQSPYISILSRSKVGETLSAMQMAKDARLTPAVAREICERNNGQAYLQGTISRLGTTYVFLLNADSCVTGKQIGGARGDAGSKEEVLTALDKAAGQIRQRVGESGASLERFQVSIANVSTPSLEALRAYSEGNQRFNQGDMTAAGELYQRALQFDPNFASAYKSLGWAYYNESQYGLAAEMSKKAFEMRARTSERERMNIEITYDFLGAGDLEAAVRTVKVYLDMFPDVAANWGNLCSFYTRMGQYDAAINAGERAWKLDAHSAFVAEQLARAYLRAGRTAEARAVAAKLVGEGRDTWGIHHVLYEIATAEGAPDQANAETDWELLHGPKYLALDDKAWAAARSGRMHRAEEHFTAARTEALRNGNDEYAARVELDRAYAYADLQETHKASALFLDLDGKTADGKTGDGETAGGRTVPPERVGLLEADLGATAAAQWALTAAETGAGSDTLRTFRELPLLRSTIALKSHHAEDATRLLEPARAYQMSNYRVPWVRARAEWAAGNLEAAAADYRLILQNPGVEPTSPLYELSHLEVARVLVVERKQEDARREYRAFLEAWREADQDLAIVSSAKRELAQLH